MAAMVAAEELGMDAELKEYYRSIGIKWHHFVPYFMIEEPLFIFKAGFWSRTFMEKNYISKFDFHQPQTATFQ